MQEQQAQQPQGVHYEWRDILTPQSNTKVNDGRVPVPELFVNLIKTKEGIIPLQFYLFDQINILEMFGEVENTNVYKEMATNIFFIRDVYALPNNEYVFFSSRGIKLVTIQEEKFFVNENDYSIYNKIDNMGAPVFERDKLTKLEIVVNSDGSLLFIDDDGSLFIADKKVDVKDVPNKPYGQIRRAFFKREWQESNIPTEKITTGDIAKIENDIGKLGREVEELKKEEVKNLLVIEEKTKAISLKRKEKEREIKNYIKYQRYQEAVTLVREFSQKCEKLFVMGSLVGVIIKNPKREIIFTDLLNFNNWVRTDIKESDLYREEGDLYRLTFPEAGYGLYGVLGSPHGLMIFGDNGVSRELKQVKGNGLPSFKPDYNFNLSIDISSQYPVIASQNLYYYVSSFGDIENLNQKGVISSITEGGVPNEIFIKGRNNLSSLIYRNSEYIKKESTLVNLDTGNISYLYTEKERLIISNDKKLLVSENKVYVEKNKDNKTAQLFDKGLFISDKITFTTPVMLYTLELMIEHDIKLMEYSFDFGMHIWRDNDYSKNDIKDLITNFKKYFTPITIAKKTNVITIPLDSMYVQNFILGVIFPLQNNQGNFIIKGIRLKYITN